MQTSQSQRKRTAAEMFPIIEKYLQNRPPHKAFCQQENLPYHIFLYWLKAYKEQNQHASATSKTQSSFLPIRLIPGQNSHPDKIWTAACELRYPNGLAIRFAHPVDADTLLQLVQAAGL